jgi:hypothetical protein
MNSRTSMPTASHSAPAPHQTGVAPKARHDALIVRGASGSARRTRPRLSLDAEVFARWLYVLGDAERGSLPALRSIDERTADVAVSSAASAVTFVISAPKSTIMTE